MAEAKVAAFMDPAHFQHSDENVAHKLLRCHVRKSFIEVQHQDRVDAGLGQQPQSLGQEGEQLRRLSGIEKLRWMRIEGDRNRTLCRSARASAATALRICW